ncbi:MAG: MoaD/ThiS family protein [archaeon]|nr:MoaD/ThiS family protein [archaeon]
MRAIYSADIARDISGKDEEMIDIKGVSFLDSVLKMICEKYPALKKEVDDGDILVLHNGETLDDTEKKKVKDTDTIEFAPVILGG